MITIDKLEALQSTLDHVLKEFGEANDMAFSDFKITYDPIHCTVRFAADTTDINADEVRVNMYAVDNYGIDHVYGRTIKVNGKDMTICGFDSKARKYKILAQDADGKRYGVDSRVLNQLR